MFKMNLQLFSGGGAKSGLGGGGGKDRNYYDQDGYATFRVKYLDKTGKLRVITFDAENQEDAEKQAKEWRRRSKEVLKMARPEILTREQAKKYER